MKQLITWKELELCPLYEVSQFGTVRSWRVEGSRDKVSDSPKELKTFFAENGKGTKSIRITYEGIKHTFSIPKLVLDLFQNTTTNQNKRK